MSTPAFDTHASVKRLVKSGLTEEQAETVTAVVNEAKEVDLSHLATKDDLLDAKIILENEISKLDASTKSDFERLRVKTKSDISEAKFELLKWMFTGFIAQAALIVTLVKLL